MDVKQCSLRIIYIFLISLVVYHCPSMAKANSVNAQMGVTLTTLPNATILAPSQSSKGNAQQNLYRVQSKEEHTPIIEKTQALGNDLKFITIITVLFF
jgi:hypothetical protein